MGQSKETPLPPSESSDDVVVLQPEPHQIAANGSRQSPSFMDRASL
jgi:hypothetical protein